MKYIKRFLYICCVSTNQRQIGVREAALLCGRTSGAWLQQDNSFQVEWHSDAFRVQANGGSRGKEQKGNSSAGGRNAIPIPFPAFVFLHPQHASWIPKKSRLHGRFLTSAYLGNAFMREGIPFRLT